MNKSSKKQSYGDLRDNFQVSGGKLQFSEDMDRTCSMAARTHSPHCRSWPLTMSASPSQKVGQSHLAWQLSFAWGAVAAIRMGNSSVTEVAALF